MSVDKRGMFRLRLMHRLGLLGPLVRTHHRIERWDDAADAAPTRPVPVALRTLRHSGRSD